MRKSILFVILVLAACASTLIASNSVRFDAKSIIPNTIETNSSNLDHIRSTLTKERVSNIFIPALIFSVNRVGSEELVSMGNVYNDTNNVAHVLTSEQIFRKDYPDQRIFRVEVVGTPKDEKPIYIGKVVAKGLDLRGCDAVTATLSRRAYLHSSFSDTTFYMSNSIVWSKIEINGKKVTELRSIATGKKYSAIAPMINKERKSAIVSFMAIDKISYPGESGTGFIDNNGGIWVLHGSISDPIEEGRIIERCKSETGKDVSGITIVSGPFGGSY